MELSHTATHYELLWSSPKRRRGAKPAALAAVGMLALHALLAFYLYKTRIEPNFVRYEDAPPVTAAIVRPQPPQTPPPPAPVKRTARPLPPQHISPSMMATPPDQTPVEPLQPVLPLPTSSVEPTPPPAPATPHAISNPRFERVPSADEMAQFYPERAARLGRQGFAVIRCLVTAKGGLTGCAVTTEDPEAYGFGEAALKLAGIFRLKPATSDGTPVDGGIFSTRISFRLPDESDRSVIFYVLGPEKPRSTFQIHSERFYLSSFRKECFIRCRGQDGVFD